MDGWIDGVFMYVYMSQFYCIARIKMGLNVIYYGLMVFKSLEFALFKPAETFDLCVWWMWWMSLWILICMLLLFDVVLHNENIPASSIHASYTQTF